MLVILFGGAWYDVTEHRIPNWWILTALLCGLGLATLAAAEGRIGLAAGGYLLRVLICVMGLFPLFFLRMFGAGDIKLMAVITGYLGIRGGAAAITYGCFVGAILALVKLLVRKNVHQRLIYLFVYFRRLFQTKEIVPYYRADRDGYGVTIPFAACLLMGYVWYLLTIFTG